MHTNIQELTCITTVFDVVYFPKRTTLSQIRDGTRQRCFYFSKFYNFFTKRTIGVFYYYSIVFKLEIKTKIRRSSSQ